MPPRYRSAVVATVAGVLDQLRPKRPIGRLEESDRLGGELGLVTGASSGIGRAVAAELARRGADVVRASRTGAEHLDLGRLQSVSDFCDRVRDARRRFAVVVVNAGVVPREARRTADGFEESFQVNFLGDVLLLGRLLADGSLGRRDGKLPRIVFVSSEAHRSAKPIDVASLGRFEPYTLTGAMAEYTRVKLLQLTFAVELGRRLAGGDRPSVSVHAYCPGAVRTGIGREAPWWSQPALQVAMRLFFRSPEKGAEPAVLLACSRALEGRTGIYLHGLTEKPVADGAADPANGRRLWEASERLLAEHGFALPPRAILGGGGAEWRETTEARS